MKIGIALIPDEKFIDQFLSLQARARSFLTLSPKLGTDRNLPHLTLIQGNFSDQVNYRDLLADLYDVVKMNHSLIMVSPQRFVHIKIGWYFLTVEKTPQLQGLHNQAFELSKAHLIAPDPNSQNLRYHPPLERENYLKYGYRYIGEAFFPHFTIGRCIDDRQDEAETMLNSLLNESDLALPVPIDRFTVYLMGEHGAHQETLCSLRLENA